MTNFIIILTAIVCIGLAGIVFYGIFVKERDKQREEDELTDDYRDEELNSVYDDYGKNEYI